MNVVFFSHMFPNQINPMAVPFMLERAKALAEYSHLKLVAPVGFFPYIKSKLPPRHESLDGINIEHPRYFALPSVLWSMRWYPYYMMCKSVWRNKWLECDIFHVEWIYPDAFAVTRFAQKRGIKTVGVVHGNEAIEYFGPLKHKGKYIEAFKYLDKIIVVSNDLKHKLVYEYHVDENKIAVILNGVHLNKFPKIDQKKARSKLGLSFDKKIGVCVARLSEEKNLDILIKSVSVLIDNKLNIYIVGDGPLKNRLEALIDSLGLKDSVKLVGPVNHDEIYWWLNAADFFCLPSQREGCPVVIHEALACGLPVLSTTVGAIPDLIKDDRFGLLCEPDSVSAFTAIMKKAMLKTWDRDAISTYGRQFTWDKVAKQTVEVFKSLLEDNF